MNEISETQIDSSTKKDEYLKEMENYFLSKGANNNQFEFGWENYFEKGDKKKLIFRFTVIAWLFYLMIPLILILLFYSKK